MVEAVEFNRLIDQFQAAGYRIIGCSPDSVQALQNFTEKHGLAFSLVSDPEKRIVTAYGAVKSEDPTKLQRSTVVIGTDGRVLQAYDKVKAEGHAARVLEDLQGPPTS